MCGISIAVNRKAVSVDDDIIYSLNNAIIHRGPDGEGFYKEGCLALGHRRLSIIDLTDAGAQPMHRGDYHISFNGEIYNYIELRDELKSIGYHFKTSSDTEVILAAYEAWGIDSFSRFNGMWAFAIYDSAKKELILCRDHFGIKPLYYTNTNNHFLAGSEIKQFCAVQEFQAKLNYEVVLPFLEDGLLNYSEQTFFKGVFELKAGHFLSYDLTDHKQSIQKWYNLRLAVKSQSLSFEEASSTFRELFNDSVKLRMRSDVEVGSCLSGGLDSSSIVVSVHSNKLNNDRFSTITSCYTDKKFDEQVFADKVSTQTGFTSIKVYPDLSSMLNSGAIDKMIYHQDQPFSTASHFSEFSVFKTARQNEMIVMLDGQGSDEYLGGYPEFYIARLKELGGRGKYIDALKIIIDKASHKKSSFLHEFRKVMRTTLLFPAIRSYKHYSGMQFPIWLNSSLKAFHTSSESFYEYDNILELSLFQLQKTSLPYQLHSQDRNTMMFSIESRLPFLDHRLVEFSLGLPSEYKVKGGYGKWILRESITELPDDIRYRKDKMGFVAPDETWIRENYQSVRMELKEAILSLGIFSDGLLKRFDDFISGEIGYEPIYFRAITLFRFIKIFKLEL